MASRDRCRNYHQSRSLTAHDEATLRFLNVQAYEEVQPHRRGRVPVWCDEEEEDKRYIDPHIREDFT